MVPMENDSHRFIDTKLNNYTTLGFWGSSPHETKMIAASFIEDEEGLKKFAWSMLDLDR